MTSLAILLIIGTHHHKPNKAKLQVLFIVMPIVGYFCLYKNQTKGSKAGGPLCVIKLLHKWQPSGRITGMFHLRKF